MEVEHLQALTAEMRELLQRTKRNRMNVLSLVEARVLENENLPYLQILMQHETSSGHNGNSYVNSSSPLVSEAEILDDNSFQSFETQSHTFSQSKKFADVLRAQLNEFLQLCKQTLHEERKKLKQLSPQIEFEFERRQQWLRAISSSLARELSK